MITSSGEGRGARDLFGRFGLFGPGDLRGVMNWIVASKQRPDLAS